MKLHRMGFSAQPEAKFAAEHQQKMHQAKDVADTERQYAEKYPGLRFITTENMQAICMKYELLLHNIDRFTGHIPDWAIDRLEGFGTRFTPFRVNVPQSQEKNPGLFPIQEPRPIGISMDRGASLAFWNATAGEPTVQMHTHNEQLAAKFPSYWGDKAQRESLLMIAAPKDQMIVYPYEQVQVGNILTHTDPIVCITVPHGYVVLVAWGEEGQDPRVFNTLGN